MNLSIPERREDRLILGFKIFGLFAVPVYFWFQGHVLVDFQVYVDALEMYAEGRNPYFKDGWEYVYPPLTLPLLSGVFAFLPLSVLLLNCLLFIYLPIKLSQETADRITSLFVLLCGAGLLGEKSLITGNLAPALYLFLFLALFSVYDMRTRELLYSLAVIFASLFKPYFLAFFIVLPHVNKSIFRSVAICVASTALVFILVLTIEPFDGAVDDFLDALTRRMDGYTRDVGYSIASTLVRLGIIRSLFGLEPAITIGLLHACLLSPVILLLLKFRDRIFEPKFLFFVIATAIILNPRLQLYDLHILFFAIYMFLLSWSKDADQRNLTNLVFVGSVILILGPPLTGIRHIMIATTFVHILCGAMTVFVMNDLRNSDSSKALVSPS